MKNLHKIHTNRQYIFLLHLTVLIWGLTGVLGKVISLDSYSIVWHRMLIAVISSLLFLIFIRHSLQCKLKTKFILSLLGCTVVIHWICFFEAIKVSNISIALTALASTSLFTAFIEPLFFKRRIHWYEPLLGLAVVIGIYIIYSFEAGYSNGIILGVLAAFIASIFITLNAVLLKKGVKSSHISFYEMLGGLIGISIWILFTKGFSKDWLIPGHLDTFYLLFLGTFCTAFAFWAGIKVMKKVSPFSVAIVGNLEPVYSIILALLFFGEDELMSSGFYVGAFLLIGAIYLNGILKNKGK